MADLEACDHARIASPTDLYAGPGPHENCLGHIWIEAHQHYHCGNDEITTGETWVNPTLDLPTYLAALRARFAGGGVMADPESPRLRDNVEALADLTEADRVFVLAMMDMELRESQSGRDAEDVAYIAALKAKLEWLFAKREA